MADATENVKMSGVVIAIGSLAIGVVTLPSVGVGPLVMAVVTIGTLFGCGVLSWSGLSHDLRLAKSGLRSTVAATRTSLSDTYGESRTNISQLGVGSSFREVPNNFKSSWSSMREALRKQ